MQRDISQKCLIIYYVSTMFCFYCIITNTLRNELLPVTIACLANFCITTALTYGRFRNANIQKYALAFFLGVCLTVYGYEKGILAYSQGTFLAIVCLCSLHLDKKLNFLIGVYVAVIYAFFIIFMPQEIYTTPMELRNVLLRLATIYIGQVMIIMLISHIELQQKQNRAKTHNAQTLLKIVEEKRKEALAANNAKSDFLANMSHEIRTPMNAIIGISEIALRGNITDDVRERLLCIKDSSKTLVSIVNEILDFSKIEAGKFEILPASYQIKSVISEVATIGLVRVEDSSIAFVLDIDPKIPSKLLGDELRIRQIMMNLVTNATKFTKSGTITLKVWCEQRVGDSEKVNLNISVKDTGIGIKEEDIARLFSSFMQVDTRKNRLVEGTGLGLAITKRLTELMQGSIHVHSIYGQGSEFSVSIPQVILEDTPVGEFCLARGGADAAVFNPTFTAPQAKVLVVDDNAVNIAVAKGVMAPYGMEVMTVSSAEACFALMPKHQFHLIFMDHMMPVMDGLEATKILRSQGVTTPIIALTANAISGARDMYMASGFDAYISKPIEVHTLDRVLGEFLPQNLVLRPTVGAPVPATSPLPAAAPVATSPLPDSLSRAEDVFASALGASPAVSHAASVPTFETPTPTPTPTPVPTFETPAPTPTFETPAPTPTPVTSAPPANDLRFSATVRRAILAEGRKKFPLMEESWQRGDWRSYAIEVHALKTTAKICHEDELYRLARDQEAAERVGNYDVLVQGFERVRVLYADLLRRVAAQEEEEATLSPAPPSASAADLPEILRTMLHHAQGFDIDGLEEQVGRLRCAAVGSGQKASVARICAALELLDYDTVCDELRHMLEQGRGI